MDITQRNKTIKKALVRIYRPSDVTVRGDRGTATGWVKILVKIDRPIECACLWETSSYTYNGITHTQIYRVSPDKTHTGTNYIYCPTCKALYEKEYERVQKIIHTCGAEFYHYCADDGYNTEREEYLLDVEIK